MSEIIKSQFSVLVVDDDDDIRSNLKDILDEVGYRTDTAADGPSALQLARERSYDVALLDFKMPGMDGATLYQELRRIHPETVAIMVTAYAGSDGIKRAKDAGTWKVLRKPVDFGNLLELIDHALHEPVVLVIDDDTDFCQSLWEILRRQGYRVALAHSEQEALARLSSRRYSVVLLDLELTQRDGGANVFRFLRDMQDEAKAILMTGHRSEMQHAIDELLQSGASAVYYKPLEFDGLLAKVSSLIE